MLARRIAVVGVVGLSACSSGTQVSNGAQGGSGNAGASATSNGGSSLGGGVGNGGTAGTTAIATSACLVSYDATPTLVATNTFNADAVARAAVVLGSCWPDDGVDRNTAHMWNANWSLPRLFYRTPMQLDCLANAKCGCAAAQVCLGYTVTTNATNCSLGCSGSVYTACGISNMPAGYVRTADCAKFGLLCDNSLVCIAGPAVPCDAAAYVASCNNGRALLCDNGVVTQGPDCGVLGLDCAAGRCVGRGATCTNTVGTAEDIETIQFEGSACTASTLTACVNGKTSAVDCSMMGPNFTCQHVGAKFFCGLGSDCSPADDGSTSSTNLASCAGTVLSFCNAGRLEHIDCTTLGFTGCEVNTHVGRYGCF